MFDTQNQSTRYSGQNNESLPQNIKDDLSNPQSTPEDYLHLVKQDDTVQSKNNEPADTTQNNINNQQNHNENILDELIPVDEILQWLQERQFSSQQQRDVFELLTVVIPLAVHNITVDFQHRIERQKLIQHFGSEQQWQNIKNNLKPWALKNLEENIYSTLGKSFEGILAMVHLMEQHNPTSKIKNNDFYSQSTPASQNELLQMMRDPRYWHHKDINYINQVKSAFQKAYD